MALAETGSKVVIAHTDPTDGEATVVFKAVESFGHLYYAFNNPGIGGTTFVSMGDYEEEIFDQVVDINFKVNCLCMKF